MPDPLPNEPLGHFQSAAGVRLLRAYGQTPHCLVAERDGRPVATWVLFTTPGDYISPPSSALARRLDVHLRAVHGPVVTADLGQDDRAAVEGALLRAVKGRANRIRPISTSLVLDPILSDHQRHQWRATASGLGFACEAAFTYAADVEMAPEDLFARIARDRRKSVRKAERLGVEAQHGESLQMLERYYGVRTSNPNLSQIPWDHFATTHEALRGTGTYQVFLATLGDRVGAGQLAFSSRRYVYLAGVSVAPWAMEERVPANDLLQWEVLRWAAETGRQTVDFVGAQPQSDDSKINAIDFFKSRWGTELRESLSLALPGARWRGRLAHLAASAGGAA